MNAKGFKDFTGIDASSGMLVKAEEKGLYKELRELFCGAGCFPDEFKN